MARDRSRNRKRPDGPATAASQAPPDAPAVDFEMDAAADATSPPIGDRIDELIAPAEHPDPINTTPLPELVASLARDHGVEAVRRALLGHALGLDADSGPGPDLSAEDVGWLEEAVAKDDPGRPTFAHPWLPGLAFPGPPEVLDTRDIAPLRLERAVLDAEKGRCTAVCRPEPVIGGGRLVMAVIAPGKAFESP